MWNKIRDFFRVESLTTRVRLAFMSIIVLLLFSGAMSLLELERVSADTEEILMASKSNADLTNEMLTALEMQNDAVELMAIYGDDISTHRVNCELGIANLHQASEAARAIMQRTETPMAADSLVICAGNVNSHSKRYLKGEVESEVRLISEIDTLYSTQQWYIEVYKPAVSDMSHQIKKYMTGSHNTLGPDVNDLSHTARRAVTPVFITLVVMIVIVLMFYFFFMLYIVKPIKRIDRSLGAYLTYKMPFDDSIRSHDEIRRVRDKIAALISKIR